jgi:DNA mismatch endonuclease (patch repair protein)
MVDVFSKTKRSQIMAKISGKETKPEIIVRKYLFSEGFRYRKNYTKIFGKPDIVLPKFKTAILIHGCFWHHHPNCKFSALPSSNTEFWANKIQRNVKRDRLVREKLKESGWQVITVWQCRLRNRESFERTMRRLIRSIHKNYPE